MLNEDPRPDDLPDGPTGYAALPPDYPPPSAERRRVRRVRRIRRVRRVRRGRCAAARGSVPVLAAVAVVAVVAAVVLAVWRIGNPTPAAQPRVPVTVVRPGDPEPVERDSLARAACGTGLSGRARRLLHPEARLVPVRRQRQAPVRHHGGAGRLRQAEAVTASPSRCARRRRPTRASASARSSSTPAAPAAPGVEYAQYSSFVFSPAVRAAYDIVGFDPRGIGASSPVRLSERLRHGPALQRRPDPRLGGRAHRRCSRTSTA